MLKVDEFRLNFKNKALTHESSFDHPAICETRLVKQFNFYGVLLKMRFKYRLGTWWFGSWRYYSFPISFSGENHIFAGLIDCAIINACDGRKTDQANA
jgi:hypothetical protein